VRGKRYDVIQKPATGGSVAYFYLLVKPTFAFSSIDYIYTANSKEKHQPSCSSNLQGLLQAGGSRPTSVPAYRQTQVRPILRKDRSSLNIRKLRERWAWPHISFRDVWRKYCNPNF